jgi:hypothetical protein
MGPLSLCPCAASALCHSGATAAARTADRRQRVCIYRTNRLFDRTSWKGWDGRAYAVPTVQNYPSESTDSQRYTCLPVLNAAYRFSWSYNTVLHAFVVLGIDTKYGPNQIEAFVYTTVRLDQDGRPFETSGEHLLREINWIDRWSADRTLEGEAYPSLLDPMSPEIASATPPQEFSPPDDSDVFDDSADFNFQFSGSHPYLYFTLFHPIRSSGDHNNRDLVRQELIVSPATDPSNPGTP